MATLNVRDYGAEGDGQTDDTAAINDAIADADEGDTVLVPATEDHYLVRATNRAAVDFTGVADDVTIAGEGPDSRLKLDRVDPDDIKKPHVLGGELDNDTVRGLEVKRLTLDGNRQENPRYTTSGFSTYPNGSGNDIYLEDVICEHCSATAFSLGSTTIEGRRLTARNNGRHGVDCSGQNSASPDVYLESVKCVDNDGTGLDFHEGNSVVEDVYCDNNRSGTKLGATGGAADRVTLRRANLRNARNYGGFRETMPDGSDPTVTLDTVQVVSAANRGFRFGGSADYEITEILAHDCGNGTDENQIEIMENSSVDADVIRSQYGDRAPGINNYSDRDDTVDRYYHYRNGEGAVSDPKDRMTIGETIEQESAFLDVPGPDDVGAYSDDGSGIPDLPDREYGDYPTPARGTEDWHETLNESFEAIEADVQAIADYLDRVED